jgi:hypothetical protein
LVAGIKGKTQKGYLNLSQLEVGHYVALVLDDLPHLLTHALEHKRGCLNTGAAIVVSSDWRNLENHEEIKGHLSPYLADHLHPDWATPIIGHRWNEVERWLARHPEVERYVILEDFAPHFDGCGKDMKARLILCTNRYGLVPELVPRITEILSR